MSDLTVTVLGCDGSFPGPGGACSGYLVRTDTTSIWLDAGTGTLANLQLHMAPQELDAVVITHEHADHSANVADFRVMGLTSDRPFSDFPVYAAPGVKERVFPKGDFEEQLQWTELEEGDELEIGDLVLTFSRTDHPVHTLAVRIEHDGKVLAYTADTGPKWSLAEFAPSSDLALVEAWGRREDEGHPAGHLSAREAARMALDADARHLVLTHIRPDHDRAAIEHDARAVFGDSVTLATTGATYVVGP